MSDTKISEAAVEAALDAPAGTWKVRDMLGCDESEHAEVMRFALAAALPHLHPQPAELATVSESDYVDLPDIFESAELAEQQGVDAHTLWAMAQLAPGEGIEDGVQRIEKALATTGKQQAGESCTHEWRTAGGGSQARRPLVCAKCNQHRDHIPQQVGEVQGDARAQFEAWALKRGLSLVRDQHYSGHQYYAYNDVELAFEAYLAARQPGTQEPVNHGDDIIIWSDGTYCERRELSQYNHMGDDYQVLWSDTGAWIAFVNRDPGPRRPTSQVAQEHVAVVGPDFTLLWAGSGPISPIVKRHGLKRGSLLYADPPAQGIDLSRVRASIQSLLNWVDDWAETPEESGINAIEAEAEAVLALIDPRDAAPGVADTQQQADDV